MAEQQTQDAVTKSLMDMKGLTEEQLYLDLSHQDILEYRRVVLDEAVRSLSEEDRRTMNNWHGAGLYGPISSVFGKLEDRYQFSLMNARNASPTVNQGKTIFSNNWKVIQNKICNEWHYCERKKEFSDENKLLIAIIALVISGTSWHIRTATAVVLLAWHQGPKFICDCGDVKPSNHHASIQ